MALVDIIGLIAAILITLGYLPQTIQTIRTRRTDDIAMASFLIILLGSLAFMMQGLLTENYFLFAANLCTGIMSFIIFFIKISNDCKKRKNKSK